MLRKYRVYITIGAVLITSAIAMYLSRKQELLQVLMSIPFVGSLTGIIVQIFRDMAAHERAILLQEAGNQFALGIGSHMANTAFDKHVAFCSEYMAEAKSALSTLLRDGPSESVLKHGWKLREIKSNYDIWLSSELEQSLEPFESALVEIGANAHYLDMIRESRNREEAKSRVIEVMYNRFAELMGFKEWEGKELTDQLALVSIVRVLRKILGTEELISLRSSILKKANTELAKSG